MQRGFSRQPSHNLASRGVTGGVRKRARKSPAKPSPSDTGANEDRSFSGFEQVEPVCSLSSCRDQKRMADFSF